MTRSVRIRVFDTDPRRLEGTERRLLRCLARRAVPAEVETVGCYLEIGRQGLTNRDPALEVNGYLVSAGAELTDAMLEDCAERLARWLEAPQAESARNAP